MWLFWLRYWLNQLSFWVNVIIVILIEIFIVIVLIYWDGCNFASVGFAFDWLWRLWFWLRELWFWLTGIVILVVIVMILIDRDSCDIDCNSNEFVVNDCDVMVICCFWMVTVIVPQAPHSLSTTRHVTSPTAVTFAVRTSSLGREVKNAKS